MDGYDPNNSSYQTVSTLWSACRAANLSYGRIHLQSGQMAYVIQCKQCKQRHGSFCGRYGAAVYDIKTLVKPIEFQIK